MISMIFKLWLKVMTLFLFCIHSYTNESTMGADASINASINKAFCLIINMDYLGLVLSENHTRN